MRISSPCPTQSYDHRRGSSMPVLSYVHQLFNVDQCQAYIHTLRWKDRPLECPRCQSQDVDPWGNDHYRPGCKRSWCNGCKRTFNDLTDTLLHQSKQSLPHWILATFLLCPTRPIATWRARLKRMRSTRGTSTKRVKFRVCPTFYTRCSWT